jgi:hypothetical protein
MLKNIVSRIAPGIGALGLLAACASGPAEQAVSSASHSPCASPPRLVCPETNCDPVARTFLGRATEFKSQRTFFLDYPCDLRAGEKVVFILNLHGAGSIGNWQRSYFPAVDYVQKYRLVVATPTAFTNPPTTNGQSARRWVAEADDEYLHGIVDQVMTEFGRANIKSFWLAGHSQGGLTSRRIVCSPYFRNKVDGFLSLSGGRVGTPANAPRPAPLPPAAGATPQPAQAAPPPLDCDFSFIFDIGELEPSSATATAVSEWATKYACQPRQRRPDVVDTQAGYVTASDQSRGPAWGRFARPGTSRVWTFEGCRDGRIVADVVRMDKGHTEGLEPHVTETIIQMMVNARGGKLQAGQ